MRLVHVFDCDMYVDTNVSDLCILYGLWFDFERLVVVHVLVCLYLCYVKVCDMVDYHDWCSYRVALYFVDVDSVLILVEIYELIYG